MKQCICGTWFTGRKDKQYCSGTCRAQHFRDQQELITQAPASPNVVTREELLITFVPQKFYEPVYDFTYHPADFWDVPATERTFHLIYQKAAKSFLQLMNERVQVKAVEELAVVLKNCRDLYSLHPDVKYEWSAASHRIFDLEHMSEYLTQTLEEVPFYLTVGRQKEHVMSEWLEQVRVRVE